MIATTPAAIPIADAAQALAEAVMAVADSVAEAREAVADLKRSLDADAVAVRHLTFAAFRTAVEMYEDLSVSYDGCTGYTTDSVNEEARELLELARVYARQRDVDACTGGA